MRTEEYSVQNLNCATCSAKIESTIAAMPEIATVNLDYLANKMTVSYHEDNHHKLDEFNKIANNIEPGVIISSINTPKGSARINPKWFVIAAGIVPFLLAFFVNQPLADYLLLAAYVMVGHRVIINAFKKMTKAMVFDEHLLMSLATFGALWLREYSEAVAVMFLYELGQYFEELSVNKSRRSLNTIMGSRAEEAHLYKDGVLVKTKLSSIKPGDRVAILPGERIPLDGIVIYGETEIDTSSLTGESSPVYATEGYEVFAGMVNGMGKIDVEIMHSESESASARILKLIEEAVSRKSSTEQFITKFAKVYTPIVVVLAFLIFLVPLLLGAEASVWLSRALVFLIVSCPCALVISIPLTYYVGIGIAAKKGIIFKGSVFLDGLRSVKTIVFDKTGTLSTANFEVSVVHPVGNYTQEELLQAALICESNSNHPLANAIKKTATGVVSQDHYNEFKEYAGKGIQAVYEAKNYYSGTSKFIRSLGFDTDTSSNTDTMIHVVRDKEYLGWISFADELRVNIYNTIARLRSLGVETISMLTGDRHAKGEAVAKLLHLDSFFAELLPQQKLTSLESIMAASNGKVAFVGDGLNDAPVIARADIGIAMGGIGNQASVESADIVLMQDKPEQLAVAYELSKRTHRIAIQNIIFALSIKILVMILGAFGLSGLWEAVIADVGVTVLAIFNAMRLARFSESTA